MKLAEKEKKQESAVGGAGFNDKLLVIGRDIGFSEMLMEYSLNMARRMGYSIIAMNLFPAKSVWTLFDQSTSADIDEDEVKKQADKGAKIFAKQAKKLDIGFEHISRAGDFTDVARQINKDRGDIDLVLVEPEYVNEGTDGPRSIPAFFLPPDNA